MTPVQSEALINEGLTLVRAGRDVEAAALFLKAQAVAPGDGVSLMYLGETLSRLGRLETAAKVFEAAVARRPQGMAFAFLSQIKRRLGQTEEGVADLERAVALDPKARWMVSLGYGRAAYKPLYERDLEGLDAIVARRPDWGLAYIARGVARGHARELSLEQNAADIRRGIQLDPRQRWALCWLAEVYRWEQRHAEAVAVLEELEAAGLADGQSLARRGESRLWVDACARAVADFDAAARLEPRDSAILAWRAEAKLWVGDDAGALADCDACLALPAPALWAHCWRGAALMRLGRLPEARRDLDLALRRDPVDAEAWIWRGELNRLEGRAAEARADLDRSLELRPCVSAWLNRALLGETGDLERARAVAPALLKAAGGDAQKALELSRGNRTARPTFAASRRAAKLRPA